MSKFFTLFLVVLLSVFSLFGCAQADSPFASEKFPLAMYAVPATEQNFSQMHEMGINYVHVYGLTAVPVNEQSFEKIQQYLDLAQKHGLKVMFDLNGKRLVPDGLEEMRSVVRRFKTHPAVGFWYLYDEPDNHKITVPQLKPFYDMVKQEDPTRPVAVCHAWTTNWYRFKDIQDILVHDIYPVTGAPFPQAKLDVQTKFTRGALKLNQTVMPALQFFNWKSTAKPGQTTLRNAPVSELRYPDAQEFRYLCFSTLAQGSRGLAFYSLLRAEMTDPNWISQTAAPVLRDVREFTDIIHQADNVTVTDEDNIIFTRWQVGAKEYVALVNVSNAPRDLSGHPALQSLKTSKLTAWKNNRTGLLGNANGTFAITMEPWEVGIWEVQP